AKQHYWLMGGNAMNEWIKLHEKDSVAIALRPYKQGEQLQLDSASPITVQDEVPFGHKIALQRIKQGEHVLKFGYSIGVATTDIEIGSWIHTHNLSTGLKGILDYQYNPIHGAAEGAAAEPGAAANDKTG